MNDAKPAISALIQLSENVFQDGALYSLLANVRDLRAEDWTAIPAGGNRSITHILEHVGASKLMYLDYAFGPGTMPDDHPSLYPSGAAPTRPPEELIVWLKEGHQRWITALAALPDDSELVRERPVSWGGTHATQRIIQIVIGHDVYHAGEINHIRALLQGNDHWT